jgi:hypothetical protein
MPELTIATTASKKVPADHLYYCMVSEIPFLSKTSVLLTQICDRV